MMVMPGRASVRALTCGAAVAAVLLAMSAFRGHSANATPAGFTIERVEKVYRVSTGEPVYTYHSTYARRPDGSSVEIRRITDPEGKVREQRTIIDLPRRLRIVVDGLTESVTTYALTGPEVAAYTQQPACAPSGPERSRLLGWDTVRIEESVKTAKGTELRVEKWVAPGLHCLPLRESVFVAHAGAPFQLASEVEVISLQRVDPPAQWFKIPAGFAERAPSAVLAEFNRRFPTNCSQCGEPTDDVLDAAYFAHRSTVPRTQR